MIKVGKLMGFALVEGPSPWGEENGVAAFRLDRFKRLGKDVDAKDHARTSAIGGVVYRPEGSLCEVLDVHRLEFKASLSDCTAYNRGLEEA